jgi:hypothetical protein
VSLLQLIRQSELKKSIPPSLSLYAIQYSLGLQKSRAFCPDFVHLQELNSNLAFFSLQAFIFDCKSCKIRPNFAVLQKKLQFSLAVAIFFRYNRGQKFLFRRKPPMFRHVSLYRLSDDSDKAANLEAFCNVMRELPEDEPSIVSIEVGKSLTTSLLPPGGQTAYDVAQILTFRTKEDCLNWPSTPAHMELKAFSSGMIELVGIIDYEV